MKSNGVQTQARGTSRPPAKHDRQRQHHIVGPEITAAGTGSASQPEVRNDEEEEEEEEEDSSIAISEEKSLIDRPKRISFCMLENAAAAVGSAINSATATVTPSQEQQHPQHDESEILSPGTPCSQCQCNLKDRGRRRSSSGGGQNGGQEFFGSSEECCSTGQSSCCNSSCNGSCGTPLASLQVMDVATGMTGMPPFGSGKMAPSMQSSPDVSGQAIPTMTPPPYHTVMSASTKEESLAAVRHVATISCPQLDHSSRLSKMSRSVPEDLDERPNDGDGAGGGSQRHLVTFVTPSMETIPLEMCQDIPDVLI